MPIPGLLDGAGLLWNERAAGVKLQSEGGGRQDGGTKESEAHFCYVDAALLVVRGVERVGFIWWWERGVGDRRV